MESKREQAMVGLFVLVASGLLIATVFVLTGAFAGSAKTYHAFFPFAGGLEPGASVRYAGGPKVGRVEQLRIDPQNAARIEITFSVKPDLPVKSDSKVRIMSLSPLGDNHLEVVPGSPQATLAASGSTLQAEPFVDFNAITAQINNIAPKAEELLETMNQRATELKVTVDRINDLVNDRNRTNLSATIANARGMLEENRPPLHSTLQRVDKSSAKLEPLLDDLRKTSGQANKTLEHVDALISEDRPDLHKAILQLRQNLDSIQDLTGQLNNTLGANSENIDEILENMRHVSENLKEFTDTIKTKPYTLLRATTPKEHKPGQP
ncbi:MAG TPA: MlaD family protein [Candidatus Dormibacteraeota bacterium]|nr:MlaD family protein [Candidatus Dormibacteraeota bacterium]